MGYELFMTEETELSPKELVDRLVAGKYEHNRNSRGVFRQICFWNCRTAPVRRCGFFVDRRVKKFVDEWNGLYENLQIGYRREYLTSGYNGLERQKPHKNKKVFGVFSLNFPQKTIDSGLPTRIILFFRLFGTEEAFLTRLKNLDVFTNLEEGNSSLDGVIAAGSISNVHNLCNPNCAPIRDILPALNDPGFIEDNRNLLLKTVRQTPFWESLADALVDEVDGGR